MELNIQKDKRSFNYIKMPYGTSNKEARKIALKDITKECEIDSNFTINYVRIEKIVLKSCKIQNEFISINTAKL